MTTRVPTFERAVWRIRRKPFLVINGEEVEYRTPFTMHKESTTRYKEESPITQRRFQGHEGKWTFALKTWNDYCDCTLLQERKYTGSQAYRLFHRDAKNAMEKIGSCDYCAVVAIVTILHELRVTNALRFHHVGYASGMRIV